VDWSYRPGKFTLGDLARHIATANRYIFAESMQGSPVRYTGCGRELAPTHGEILSLMEALHGESLEIFSRLTDLNAKCKTPDGASMATWKWLRAMLEHEIHHRGQIYIYLAMLDVPTPPLYGLTSEQIVESSRRARP
jgi:uncharacterized damage-inducible protein DinB